MSLRGVAPRRRFGTTKAGRDGTKGRAFRLRVVIFAEHDDEGVVVEPSTCVVERCVDERVSDPLRRLVCGRCHQFDEALVTERAAIWPACLLETIGAYHDQQCRQVSCGPNIRR
jgi:hypothetical protein